MAKSELHFLGRIINPTTVETNYNKLFNTYSGMPILYNGGGLLKFVFDFVENATFLERMTTIDYKRYKLGYPVDDGKIVFYNANDDVLKTWEFKDASIVYYKETFKTNDESMTAEMILSPAIQDYGYKINRSWHITPITEQTHKTPVHATEQKEKKPFRIDISAKISDIKNGVFGFDKIPSNYNHICKSDIEKLRQEYKPIARILDDEYLPPWLSIRKGQTVELELD
ncbi:type VI secretion system tube protein TssD [Mariniflexile ostreae]|uniref:Type VI secretion system tube protein TssD n=1 Tax=Mariniflexile ostreae TaxID=1520892 RepID=A0ABV5FBP3_9FLAO